MPATFLIGASYGDEGKGRVARELAREHQVAARCNGGANAQHTVFHEGSKLKLRQVPCGILQPGVLALAGTGMLIDPFLLVDELAALAALGVDTAGFRLCAGATLVLPLHVAEDGAVEERRGDTLIGTTRNGIGPAMADKARRIALRAGDLAFPERVRAFFAARDLWQGTTTPVSTRRSLQRRLAHVAGLLAPHLVHGPTLLHEALARGARVLIEGAQGTLLDVDHGAWPHVTAGHVTIGGALASLGLSHKDVGAVIGVTRSYATRQAPGFFPTEATLAHEGALRAATGEHAVRVGWLDLVALRVALRLNGFDELIVTGIDRLAGLDTLRLCRAYRLASGEELTDRLPPRGASVVPLYDELAGFSEDVSTAQSTAELPPAAASFLDAVEQGTGVPVLRFSNRRAGPLARRGSRLAPASR